MQTQEFSYQINDKTFTAYCALPADTSTPKPAVIVAHAFEGRNDLMCAHARKLAEWGYVGIAIDMYGDKYVASTFEECIDMIMPLINNRTDIRTRIEAALSAVKALDCVDADKVAAMGFCFGGLCLLELARNGSDINGVVSIHGILNKDDHLPTQTINSKVLVLHGYEDPQAPPSDLTAFAEEMNTANADWQCHFYSHTKHAFTDPEADKLGPPEVGREYNPLSNQRAWAACQSFFAEIL